VGNAAVEGNRNGSVFGIVLLSPAVRVINLATA